MRTAATSALRIITLRHVLAMAAAVCVLQKPAASWCASLPAPVLEPRFTVTSLGVVPAAAIASTVIRSPDDRHLAYVATEAGSAKKHVVLDGAALPSFSDIPVGKLSEAGRAMPLRFSPDSKHLAYVATVDGGCALVLDGEPGKPYSDIGVGKFAFSPDSKHLVCVAASGSGEGRKERVVMDGREGTAYDFIDAFPRFSWDSAHLYYTARANDRSFIIRDGKVAAEASHLSNLTFSPDGDRLAFVQREGEKWQVVVDGRVEGPYDSIGNNLVFSRDGKRFLYSARRGTDGFLVVDGKELGKKGTVREASYGFDATGRPYHVLLNSGGTFAEIGDGEFGPYKDIFGGFSFSEDGSHFSFTAADGTGPNGRWMVIDGKPGSHFDYFPSDVQFSAHGEHSFYAGTRAGKTIAVVDGKEFPCAAVAACRFSPDGKHVAWAIYPEAGSEKAMVYVDNKEQRQVIALASGLFFSPDGQHLAFLQHRPGMLLNGAEFQAQDSLMVDGKVAVTQEAIRVFDFTADDKSYVLVAQTRDGAHLEVQGKQVGRSAEFEEIMDLPGIVRDSTSGGERFHAVGRRGEELFRIELVLPAN